MAGEWIKMRHDLPDDPAVIAISDRLQIDTDTVVGKLHRLWTWADKHTENGFAPGITGVWVDRYVGSTGFAAMMISVGWIDLDQNGIQFVHFERHNGESAKTRSLNTLRQRLSRKERDEGATGLERTPIPRPFRTHVYDRDGFRCAYCGKTSSRAAEEGRRPVLSIDHIMPETRGGSGSIDNLLTTCRLCNSEKGDRTPLEWGVEPTFLAPGISYEDGRIIDRRAESATAARQQRDKSATRGEESRGDSKRKDEVLSSVPNNKPKDISSARPLKRTGADGFSRLWDAYPGSRRRNRKALAEKWRKQRLDAKVDLILERLEQHKGSQQWKDGFIPLLATWINQEAWEQDLGSDDGDVDGFTWSPAPVSDELHRLATSPLTDEERQVLAQVPAIAGDGRDSA